MGAHWMRHLIAGGALAVALVFGLSMLASAATPEPGVTKRDAASTKAFIALQERGDIDVIRSAPVINATEHAFAAQIRVGCPGVLAHLPKRLSRRQGSVLERFALESAFALEISAVASLRGAVSRIAKQQRTLRFSDPELQRQVHVDGTATAAYYALRPPRLCADGRLIAHSTFTRITPAGTRFVRDALALESSAAASPTSLVRRMRSYALAAVTTALKRLAALKRTLVRRIPLAHDYEALLRVLGLKNPSRISVGSS